MMMDSNETSTLSNESIVLVGCGNMGGAMLAGWLRFGVPAEAITVIDPYPSSGAKGTTVLPSVPKGLAAPTTLVLAVKPAKLAEVAPAIAPLAGPDTLLLSVLAAVEIETLRKAFPQVGNIVRAVPNLPAAIGLGVTALAGEGLGEDKKALAQALCAPLGTVEWLDAEPLCDAATSVSGCGPAFLFRFADAIARAGELQGLGPAQARRLIANTMIGAGTLMLEPDADPGDMARRVASPGGVTQAGLDVLDHEDALKRLIGDTLAAAARRNGEMTAASRHSHLEGGV